VVGALADHISVCAVHRLVIDKRHKPTGEGTVGTREGARAPHFLLHR
jgi:hypothetical protein